MIPSLLPKGLEAQFQPICGHMPSRGDTCLFWFHHAPRLAVVIDHVSRSHVRVRCEGYHVDAEIDRLTVMQGRTS